MMVFQQVSQRPSIVLTIGDDDGAGEEDDDEDGLHDATDKEEAVGWLVGCVLDHNGYISV